MSIAAPELIMVGTSAASASCCIAPPARAIWRARALAVVMVALMGAMAVGAVAEVQYALVAIVVAVAGSVAMTDTDGDRSVAWHRALGAGLMVLFVLLHLHATQGASGLSAQVGHHAGAVPLHDVLVLHVLQAWTVAYAVATAVVVFRMRSVPGTAWLRGEHVTMTASLIAMGVLMG